MIFTKVTVIFTHPIIYTNITVIFTNPIIFTNVTVILIHPIYLSLVTSPILPLRQNRFHDIHAAQDTVQQYVEKFNEFRDGSTYSGAQANAPNS